MNAKIAFTLILGLVFQLAQVLPGAVMRESCPPQAESCKCCAGLDTCPCAENGAPDQKPAPLAPDSGSVFKLPAARTGEGRVAIEFVREPRLSAVVAACPIEGPPAGYGGVRLAVAFCTFVM